MKTGKITAIGDQHVVVDGEIFCSQAIVTPWPASVGDTVSTASVPHTRHKYPRKAIRYKLVKRVTKTRAEIHKQDAEAHHLEEIRKSYLEAQKLTRHNRKEDEASKRAKKKQKRGRAPDPKRTWSNADDTSQDHNPMYQKRVGATYFGQRRSGAGSFSEKDDAAAAKSGGRKVELHWKDKPLNDMTTRDWRILREDYDINIRGGFAVSPLRSWAEAGLPETLMRAIDRQGYKEPTPIQRQCVPIGVQSRDLIGLAETGSGKTVAFVLPMLLHILRLDRSKWEACKSEGPLALIMAPVRELVTQISEETQKMLHYVQGLTCCTIIGGTSMEQQAFELQAGRQIVVATPGRLIDLIKSHYLVLRQCKYLILDEADRMITMGFEENVETVLRAMRGEAIDVDDDGNVIMGNSSSSSSSSLMAQDSENRPTIHMFSATMPQAVSNLAKTYLHQPVYVQIGDVDSMKNRRIVQNVIMVKQKQKLSKIQDILRRNARVPAIVFVNARKSADLLARDLRNSGVRCSEYHGGHSQDARELALQSFKDGAHNVLIATDVAGRGLDVKGVMLVVNYDMSSNIEKYTHRIGRTGRAGKTGTAVTLLTQEDEKVFEELSNYLTSTKSVIPRELTQAVAKGTRRR